MPLVEPSSDGGSTRRRFMVWRAEGSSGSIGNKSGVDEAGGGVDARALFSMMVSVTDGVRMVVVVVKPVEIAS